METLSPRLDEAAIQHLRASLRGTIVRPGGDDYEATRRIWVQTLINRIGSQTGDGAPIA